MEDVSKKEPSGVDEDAQGAGGLSSDMRERTSFLASHELRLSIGSLIAAFDAALGDDNLTVAALRGQLQSMRGEMGEMARLADAILSISRPDPGHIPLKKDFFNAAHMVDRVVARLDMAASRKGVGLKSRVPESLRIHGDAEWIRKIMESLVLKALQITPRGKEVQIFQPRKDKVMLAIWDQGPGLEPEVLAEKQALLKHPPRREALPYKEERRPEGEPPLHFDDLFIAQVALAHGGSLLLESKLGEGSVHTLDFPELQPRVLVVDDEEMDRELVLMFLAGLNVEIEEADSGKAALQAMERQRPDLVISDITMPDMDGFELLKLIKAAPGLGDVPVVLVTGDAKVEQRVRAFRLGASDFVIKPVSAQEFIGQVRQLIG